MKTYPAMAVLASVLALGVAGCSGSQPSSASSGTKAGGTASGTTPSSAAASSVNVPPGVVEQYATLRKEIAGTKTAGPWRIGYITEDAEGWFVGTASGNARWRAPKSGETNHIEILPFEKNGGRLVPNVPITVAVIDTQGNVVDRQKLQLYYQSKFFHYASNFSIPQPGRYTLEVTLGVPEFPRHGDKQQKPALAEGAQVQFDNVELG